MTRRTELALFLLILAIGMGASNALVLTSPPDSAGMGIALLTRMWAPALAATVAALLARRSLRGFGWRLGPARFLLLAYLFPLAYVGVPFAIAIATGGGRFTAAMWPFAASHLGLPADPLLGLVMLATLNVAVSLVFALGEEIGWRGYLVPRLAERHGFWGVVSLSWAVWFAFHLPGFFTGGFAPDALPLWVAVPCFGAILYAASASQAWLRLRSGSLWPPALAHAAHNVFIGELFASAIEPSSATPYLLTEFGPLVPVVCIALTTLLVLRGGVPDTSAAMPRRAAARGAA